MNRFKRLKFIIDIYINGVSVCTSNRFNRLTLTYIMLQNIEIKNYLFGIEFF